VLAALQQSEEKKRLLMVDLLQLRR